jgi:hypothetical protein
MKRAFDRRYDVASGGRFWELFDYFFKYIPSRERFALQNLTGAFAGVLSVEFDVIRPEPEPEPVVRKRGRLERWAERRRL